MRQVSPLNKRLKLAGVYRPKGIVMLLASRPVVDVHPGLRRRRGARSLRAIR